MLARLEVVLWCDLGSVLVIVTVLEGSPVCVTVVVQSSVDDSITVVKVSIFVVVVLTCAVNVVVEEVKVLEVIK